MRAHLLAAVLPLGLLAAGAAMADQPKYYFQLREVRGGQEADSALKEFVAEAVKNELAARPEFTSDIGGVTGDAAIAAELQKRGLKGFELTMAIDRVKRDVREVKAGLPSRVVEASVKLTLFGNTLPGNKLAFSGEGESGLKSEVSAKRADSEAVALTKDAAKDAVKQAVEQGLARLTMMSLQTGPAKDKPKAAKPGKAKAKKK